MPRWWLTVLSWAAPASRRAEWRLEWTGEQPHFQGRAWRGTIAALSHALWLRRLEWEFVMQDIRFALRLLGRQPIVAGVIIGTLAIGIGGATTMFSVVNGVLLRPPDYPDPGRLVWMFGAFSANDSAAVSPPDFVDYRERNDAFESLGAMTIGPSGVTLDGPDGPELVQASDVSSGLISTLGVQPLMGRDFTREEERTGGPPVVIISHRLWQDRFNAAPDIVGQSLSVDGRVRTVVGVMPQGFALPYDPFVVLSAPVDVYVPLPLDSAAMSIRRFHFLRLVGRLQPSVTVSQAQTRLDVIAKQLADTYAENDTWHLRLLTLQERLVGDVRPRLLVLFGAVGLVLLVACGNVAGVLLARATGRQAEVSLRSALGASRSRIIRQLVVEGAVLSTLGALAGVCLASWSLGVVQHAGPTALPRLSTVSLDLTAVGFAMAMAVVATVLCSLVPARQASQPGVWAGLGLGSRSTGSGGRAQTRQVLVVGQVALAVVLLVGAGLLVRSYLRLDAVDLGFRTDGVVLSPMDLPAEAFDTPEKIDGFFTELTERLQALPGVAAVGFTTTAPLVGSNDTAVHPADDPPTTAAERRGAQVRWVRGRFFDAFDIPLRAGRLLDDRVDTPGQVPVVVINQAMADSFFPGKEPVGQRVAVDLNEPVVAEVVGVVGDTRVFGPESTSPSIFYMSARQFPSRSPNLVAHVREGYSGFAADFRRVVRDLAPTLAVDRIQSMTTLAAGTVAPARFRTGLIAVFAMVALLLTLVGLYGMLSFAVAQRRREIGIRLALGAQSGEVVRMVVWQGGRLVVLGVLCGLAVALVATRLVASMLFEVTPRDPLVFTVVPLVLALFALVVVAIPARRASQVEASTSLRVA